MKKHIIAGIQKNSITDRLGVMPGDALLSVNGQNVTDVFDYRSLIQDELIRLCIRKKSGEEWVLDIEKGPYDDPGLVFEPYLMDKTKECANKCIFCFVDQLPGGMRETLYVKDDDPRLSFLTGNYVTLTNMSGAGLKRLIRHRLSPINISVHTTDPQLRAYMLNNPKAGRIMEQIKTIADAGLSMNFQVVLVKSVNDGAALEETVETLSAFYPLGQSLSIVPAGLSGHRHGLYEIEAFTHEDAKHVIAGVHKWQRHFREKLGSSFVYAADEFYLLAEQDMPPYSSYEDFPQIENGVGMMAQFMREFTRSLKKSSYTGPQKTVDIATGAAAHRHIHNLALRVAERFPQITVRVHSIENKFFGGLVTVSGLLTGGDIINALKGKLKNSEKLLIPQNALKPDSNVFLDDTNISSVSERLSIRAVPCEISGSAILKQILLEEI